MSDVADSANTIVGGEGAVGRMMTGALGLLGVGLIITGLKLADKALGEALGTDGPVTQAVNRPKPAFAM